MPAAGIEGQGRVAGAGTDEQRAGAGFGRWTGSLGWGWAGTGSRTADLQPGRLLGPVTSTGNDRGAVPVASRSTGGGPGAGRDCPLPLTTVPVDLGPNPASNRETGTQTGTLTGTGNRTVGAVPD